jgi:hypothetical protein
MKRRGSFFSFPPGLFAKAIFTGRMSVHPPTPIGPDGHWTGWRGRLAGRGGVVAAPGCHGCGGRRSGPWRASCGLGRREPGAAVQVLFGGDSRSGGGRGSPFQKSPARMDDTVVRVDVPDGMGI